MRLCLSATIVLLVDVVALQARGEILPRAESGRDEGGQAGHGRCEKSGTNHARSLRHTRESRRGVLGASPYTRRCLVGKIRPTDPCRCGIYTLPTRRTNTLGQHPAAKATEKRQFKDGWVNLTHSSSKPCSSASRDVHVLDPLFSLWASTVVTTLRL